MSVRERLGQREIDSRWLLGVLEEYQSCSGPRLESKAGGIFLKMEDTTSSSSESGGEEELGFQGALWLDLSDSASRGRVCPHSGLWS